MKRALLLLLIPASVLLARTVHGKLYNLKTGEVDIVSFTSHGFGNPSFEVRMNSGEVITGEMVRGGGPTVLEGSSVTTANGLATVNGPEGTSNIAASGNAATHTTWIKNPLVRKGNMIGTSPSGLVFRCGYNAQAGLVRGHGSGPCEDNRGGEYTVTF